MTRRRLDGLYAVQGVAFGLLMPFIVPLLVERGGVVWVVLRGQRFGPQRTVPIADEMPAPPPPA